MSRAMVLEEPGRLVLRNGVAPTPAAGEVLIQVAWAGICGSDVDLFEGRRPPGYVRYPIVPGHEWSGIVVDAGPGVDRRLVGAPVVAEGIRPCTTCRSCRVGDATQCETRYDETGFTRDGAWADFLVVPAALAHRLPERADLRAAVGIEPAACAAAAVERGDIEAGERVAIVGGGTIGLLAAQLTRATQPSELVVLEPVEWRAPVALQCGATRVVTKDTSELDSSFDVVIEAAGALGSAQTAVRLARRGGRVVLAGIPATTDVVTTQDIVAKQLVIRAVFGAPHRAWEQAVKAFCDGLLDPGILATHELSIEEAGRAIELVARHDPAVGKVLLRP